MNSVSNRIVGSVCVMGNSGVGKSHILRKLCLRHGMKGEDIPFIPSSGDESMTTAITSCRLKGTNMEIIEFPGFFDTDGNDPRNGCKMVQKLEGIKNILIVLFVYVGRYSEPEKIWFNRIQKMLENHRNVYKVKNKFDKGSKIENNVVFLKHGFGEEYVDVLMKFVKEKGVQDEKGVKIVVPEICYETIEKVKGVKVLPSYVVDEGYNQQRSRQVWDGSWGKVWGKKKTIYWNEWVRREKTYYDVEMYEDIFKIRFDKTKDFIKRNTGQIVKKLETIPN